MKRLLFLSIAASLAVYAGCESKGTTGTAATPRAGTATDGKMGADDSKMGTVTVVEIFKAEPANVTVAPGGETTVKLVNPPKGAILDATVEPADAKLNVAVDKETLTIKAADGASGSATIMINGGDKVLKVPVEIQKK